MMAGGMTFCSVADLAFLPRLLVLHSSLCALERPFALHVLCMDEPSERVLRQLALPSVVIVGIHQLDGRDPNLAAACRTRTHKEAAQTSKPSLLLSVLAQAPPEELVTFLDADLYFYADPCILLAELEHDDSILLHAHRYPPEWSHWAQDSGEFNTGFIAFRNDERGLAAVRWWRDRCLEWCYDRVEPGRYCDQHYVHDWPHTRDGVHVVQHPGAGVAPWNARRHELASRGGQPWIDGEPVVFYHFQSLRLVRGLKSLRRIVEPEWAFEPIPGRDDDLWATSPGYELSETERRIFWRPYLLELATAVDAVGGVDRTLESALIPRRLGSLGRAGMRRAAPSTVRQALRRAAGRPLPRRVGA